MGAGKSQGLSSTGQLFVCSLKLNRPPIVNSGAPTFIVLNDKCSNPVSSRHWVAEFCQFAVSYESIQNPELELRAFIFATTHRAGCSPNVDVKRVVDKVNGTVAEQDMSTSDMCARHAACTILIRIHIVRP